LTEVEEIKERWRNIPIGKDPVLVAVTAREDIYVLLTKIVRQLELLERLEWSYRNNDREYECPACGVAKNTTHEHNCWLAEEIYD
jgi:hypothetical protein